MDDYVEPGPEKVHFPAKGFADEPPCPVAVHGFRKRFLAHHDAYACPVQAVSQAQKRKIPYRKKLPVLVHQLEIIFPCQSVLEGKHLYGI